jgi:hypothetical protein
MLPLFNGEKRSEAMVKTSKFMTKSASFVQRVSCQTTLGIGLALMQELAKLHGGAVRAESIYGKGSRFIVTIPLGYSHLPAAHVGTGVLPEYELPCLCVPSKTSRMLGRLPGLCQ